MKSMLYSSRTIETKYFLLSNLKIKKKFGGYVRTQEFGCSNYYGGEIKNPIYETIIQPIEKIGRNPTIRPINLFNSNNHTPKKKFVSLRESCRFILKNKNNKGARLSVAFTLHRPKFFTGRLRNDINSYVPAAKISTIRKLFPQPHIGKFFAILRIREQKIFHQQFKARTFSMLRLRFLPIFIENLIERHLPCSSFFP